MKKIFVLSILSFVFSVWNVSAQTRETLVLMETNYGTIKIKLYNETPKHRDNFIKLVNEKYYSNLLFHRVINQFMIQCGDPNSRNASQGAVLGSGGPGYTIPAEFNAKLYHKKGALSAARMGDNVNPRKESSGSQFYIVQGKKMTDAELTQLEDGRNAKTRFERIRGYIMKPENQALLNQVIAFQNSGNQAKLDSVIGVVGKIVDNQYKNTPKFKYTPEQRKTYINVGGTPFLDGDYTVFGEVVQGLDIIDKIAIVKTDKNDRPEADVVILNMKIVTK